MPNPAYTLAPGQDMTSAIARAFVLHYAPDIAAVAVALAESLRARWPSCAPEVRVYDADELARTYTVRHDRSDRICAGQVAWTDPGTGGHRVAAVVVDWDTGAVWAVGAPDGGGR